MDTFILQRESLDTFIFLGWAYFSYLVGWFWRSRGLGPGWGLFLSLLLSPLVGFLIGLMRRSNLKTKDQYDLEDGERKACPFCAEIIRSAAVVCRYCARELPPEPLAPLAPSAPEPRMQGRVLPPGSKHWSFYADGSEPQASDFVLHGVRCLPTMPDEAAPRTPGATRVPVQQRAPADSVETTDRGLALYNLKAFHERQLISEEEYLSRRAALVQLGSQND